MAKHWKFKPYKRLNTVGKKHWNWKGGVGSRSLKRAILIRDDYTCQDCGLREPPIMQVDHVKTIRDNPKKQFDLKNLITRCPNCHVRKSVKNKEYTAKRYDTRQK